MYSFLTGIQELIRRLMADKEKEYSYRAKEWMSTEAAAVENINKAGTFRYVYIN